MLMRCASLVIIQVFCFSTVFQSLVFADMFQNTVGEAGQNLAVPTAVADVTFQEIENVASHMEASSVQSDSDFQDDDPNIAMPFLYKINWTMLLLMSITSVMLAFALLPAFGILYGTVTFVGVFVTVCVACVPLLLFVMHSFLDHPLSTMSRMLFVGGLVLFICLLVSVSPGWWFVVPFVPIILYEIYVLLKGIHSSSLTLKRASQGTGLGGYHLLINEGSDAEEVPPEYDSSNAIVDVPPAYDVEYRNLGCVWPIGTLEPLYLNENKELADVQGDLSLQEFEETWTKDVEAWFPRIKEGLPKTLRLEMIEDEGFLVNTFQGPTDVAAEYVFADVHEGESDLTFKMTRGMLRFLKHLQDQGLKVGSTFEGAVTPVHISSLLILSELLRLRGDADEFQKEFLTSFAAVIKLYHDLQKNERVGLIRDGVVDEAEVKNWVKTSLTKELFELDQMAILSKSDQWDSIDQFAVHLAQA